MTNENRSPEEIEREIERERAGLKDSINDLQERFSFDGMFQQIGDQFREHGGEFGRSVARSARENPIALALTGAGLAWLILGNNRSSDTDDWRYSAEGSDTARGRVGGFSRDRGRSYEKRASWERGNVADHGDLPRTAARRGGSYVGPKTGAVARGSSHPTWARDWDDTERGYQKSGLSSGTSSSTGSTLGSAASDAQGKVAAGASAAAGAVSSAAGTVRDTASDMAHSASDTASGAAQGVRDSAGNLWGSATQYASAVQRRLSEGTEHLSEEARDRIAAARARAMDARDEAARRFGDSAERATDFYDNHPLVVGAVAFALGAAIAGALPRTRIEDEYVGGYSDELYDEAERIYSEEVDKAQKVVQAGMDEAKNVASDLGDDVRDAAQTAADKATSAAGRVADAARDKAEDENLGGARNDTDTGNNTGKA